MTERYRGRFAPSPTGDLHLGSLLAAVGSWLRARAAGGTWLVRIEDVDRTREVPGAADRQLATLAAFGMVSDEPVWRQSARDEAYAEALRRLVARDLAFPCRCSRRRLGEDGVHPARCPGGADEPGRAPAWRVRVPEVPIDVVDLAFGPQRQDLAREVGAFVVRRVDGYWAYQLAVVVDDAAQGITEVVRGADLLDSTPRQIWLQRALGLPTPRYLHLPLLLGPDGAKLSKQAASRPVDPSDPGPALDRVLDVLGIPSTVRPAGPPARVLEAVAPWFDPRRLACRAVSV